MFSLINRLAAIQTGVLGLLLLLTVAPAQGLLVSAHQDNLCPGDRIGQNLNCTANDFTATAVFSAAPNQPSFCVSGQPFEFIVNLGFTSSNALRYDIGFFSSQNGSNILSKTSGDNCSVATFPISPAPWQNSNSNGCGDFAITSSTVVTVDKIKVLCQGDALGNLLVPYVITYGTSTSVCTDYTNVAPSTSSKCTNSAAPVSDSSGGNIQVFAGAYVDITKQTSPDLDSQPFSFTATASNTAAKVSAGLIAADGSTPIVPPPTTYSSTYSNLTDGQTVRFFVNLPSSGATQTLTITEAATTHWENTANITCSQGSVDNGTRTITIPNLSSANPFATCTVTNTKRSKITLVNTVAGRINDGDTFRVQATGGGTLTDNAGTSISAPRNVDTGLANSAQEIFWSQPGQQLTFTDSVTSGSSADYTYSYACSNGLSGSATFFNLTPGPGDDITCTYTNAAKPTLTKAFSTTTVGIGQAATLTFTITNPSAASPARSGLSFTDTLPTNLVVAAIPNATSTCGTPTITANPGGTSIGASDLDLAAGASTCTVSVNVSSTVVAGYVNGNAQITAISALLRNGVTNQPLAVVGLTNAKAFVPAAIDVYEPSAMTFTLTNPNSVTLTNLNFTDTLTGFKVRTATIGGTCAGVTNAPPLSVGDTALNLTVPSLPPGSCTITIPVYSSAPGSYNNTTSTATFTANGVSGLTGLASNTATLAVNRLPLQLTKVSTSGATVAPGGTVNYTIGYANPNVATPFQSVVITDPLPLFTTFLSASCGPLPAGISSCTIAAPAVGAIGTVTWTLGGSLNAGASGNVYLSVHVQ
jgi:uncharacterized repeat protein (TIGR01451 family)